MPDKFRREIIHEHEFEEQLERLLVNMEEADEFMASAEDLLSYEPTAGRLASEEFGLWSLAMFPIRGKTVTLYYSFDERTVTLVSIIAFDE